MDYDSVGRFTTDTAKKMLKVLREYVPHIYWNLGFGDEEQWSKLKYSDICVPEFQLEEADFVIGLMENKKDLSQYTSDGRFPVLFEEKNGDFFIIKPLTMFAENVKKLINLLEGVHGDDGIEYLRKISKLLLNIYTLQYDLPDCVGGTYYQPWLDFSLSNNLEPFSFYYDVGDPFTSKVDNQYLEKTLENILEILQTGIVHYDIYCETKSYKNLSIAVNVWKNQYNGKYGWGTAAINALKVIHYASTYLQKGILPISDSKESPENYLFAHCIYEISDIEKHETILADWNTVRLLHDLADFARINGELISSHYEEVFNTIDCDLWNLIIGTFYFSEEEIALLVEFLPQRERNLVENKSFDEWPVEEFIYGFIWDSLWKLIDNRIKEAEHKIRNGEGTPLGIISNWVDLFNCVMENALGKMYGKEAYIYIQLGDVTEFPVYFVNNVLDRIEYHQTEGYKYPLTPFREVVLALRRTIDQPDWYKNEIQFGRYLEWVNIFKAVGK